MNFFEQDNLTADKKERDIMQEESKVLKGVGEALDEIQEEELYDYRELFLCLAPLTYEEIEQMRINDKPRKKEIINE